MSNPNNRSPQLWQRLMLSMLTLLVSLSMHEFVSAKPTLVVNTQPRVVRKGKNPGGNSLSSSSSTATYLNCNGEETLIMADENGETQVYVNDGTAPQHPEVTLQEYYRVVLPSSVSSWSKVDIYANGTNNFNADAPLTDRPINITMTGGKVHSISLNAATTSATSTLIITGGELSSLSTDGQERGKSANPHAVVFIDNLTYTGTSQLSSLIYTKQLFVGTSCRFTHSMTCPTRESISLITGLNSAIIASGNDIYAFGTGITIPEGTSMQASSLITEPGTSFTNHGTIRLLLCDGLKDSHVTITGNQPQVAPHYVEEECLQHEDCEKEGLYITRCYLCGQVVNDHLTKPALGHIVVPEEGVAATCSKPGLSSGSHCGRCGKALEAHVETPMLLHTFTDWEIAEAASCTGAGSQKRRCMVCGYTETSGTDATGHLFVDDWYTLYLPTCNLPGKERRECTLCGLASETRVTSALGHRNHIHHAAIPATCTTDGMEAYYECGECGQFMRRASAGNDCNVDYLPTLAIPAFGHQFTRSELLEDHSNYIHDSSCIEPALGYKLCTRCDAIGEGDDLTFVISEAKGHRYFIKHLESLSDVYAENGMITIGCLDCEEEWPHFEFNVIGASGTYTEGEPFDGYWYKAYLIETIKKPTCISGWGRYALDLNYKGQSLSMAFYQFIPPVYGDHNYGLEDGVCHEKHYEYVRDADGNVIVDYNGNLEYQLDANGERIEDNTVYTAKARLNYYADCYYKDENDEPLLDEIGNPVTYKGQATRTFASVDEALIMASQKTDDHTELFLFDNVTMTEDMKFQNFNSLDIDLNGRIFDASYEDSDTQSIGYRCLEIANNFNIKNGTFKADVLNWGDHSVFTLDAVQMECRSLTWGESSRCDVVLINGSDVTIKEHYHVAGYTDIDASSVLHSNPFITGRGQTPGCVSDLRHYLPDMQTIGNINLDADLLHFYGRNRTQHTFGMVDGGLDVWDGERLVHYPGCTLCGYFGEEDLDVDEICHNYGIKHTTGINGLCTACGHNPHGTIVSTSYDDSWELDLRCEFIGCPHCGIRDYSSIVRYYDDVFELNDETPLYSYSGFIAQGFKYERLVKPGVLTTLVLPAAIPASKIHGTLYVLQDYSSEEGLMLVPANKVSSMIDENGYIQPGKPYIVKVEESDQPMISLVDPVNEEVFINGIDTWLTTEASPLIMSGIYERDFMIENTDEYNYYVGGDSSESFTLVNERTKGHRFECVLGLPQVFNPTDLTLPGWESSNHADSSTSTTPNDDYTFTLDENLVMKFNWSVSSEANYDLLNIWLCDLEAEEEEKLVDRASSIATGSVSCSLKPGTYYLKCQYKKDSSASANDDKASISSVSFLRLAEALASLPYTILRRSGSIDDGEEYTSTTEVANIDITYTRHFDNDYFNPLYVPFSMQYADWSSVADVYELSNIYEEDYNDDGDIDAWTLQVLRLKEDSHTEANMPYLIRPKEVGDIEIIVPGTTLVPANSPCMAWVASTRYNFDFYGVYRNFSLPANKYYFMSTEGGLQYNDIESTLRPQRWYMEVSDKRTGRTITPSSLEATSGARFRIVVDDETTDIEQIHTLDAEAPAFDLMGRRLSKPGKGLHIINNNKVMRF